MPEADHRALDSFDQRIHLAFLRFVASSVPVAESRRPPRAPSWHTPLSVARSKPARRLGACPASVVRHLPAEVLHPHAQRPARALAEAPGAGEIEAVPRVLRRRCGAPARAGRPRASACGRRPSGPSGTPRPGRAGTVASERPSRGRARRTYEALTGRPRGAVVHVPSATRASSTALKTADWSGGPEQALHARVARAGAPRPGATRGRARALSPLAAEALGSERVGHALAADALEGRGDLVEPVGAARRARVMAKRLPARCPGLILWPCGVASCTTMPSRARAAGACGELVRTSRRAAPAARASAS